MIQHGLGRRTLAMAGAVLALLVACSSNGGSHASPVDPAPASTTEAAPTSVPATAAFSSSSPPNDAWSPSTRPRVIVVDPGANAAPCSLLTSAEVDAFLGGHATMTPVPANHSCQWSAIGKRSTLILQVLFDPNHKFHVPTFDATVQKIPELGAAAELVFFAHDVPTVYVPRGNGTLTVGLGGGSTDDTKPWVLSTPERRAAFIALAKSAFARI